LIIRYKDVCYGMVRIDHHAIVVLAGPTASGKSALALDIAQTVDAVIINCDSRQIYREIPVITAQPTPEEQQLVPHRLYGCLSAADHCSVAAWVGMARDAIDAVHAQGKLPFLVGGTGMYIKALMEGFSPIPDIDPLIRKRIRVQYQQAGNKALYSRLRECDPVMADILHEGDTQRVMRALEVVEQTGVSLRVWQQKKPMTYYGPEQFRTFFLYPDKQTTYERCSERFYAMLDRGVLDEVRALDALKLPEALPAMKAHGVPELRAHLRGDLTLDEAVKQAVINTRHYIKRQFTWYRHQMQDAERIDMHDYKMVRTRIALQIGQLARRQ